MWQQQQSNIFRSPVSRAYNRFGTIMRCHSIRLVHKCVTFLWLNWTLTLNEAHLFPLVVQLKMIPDRGKLHNHHLYTPEGSHHPTVNEWEFMQNTNHKKLIQLFLFQSHIWPPKYTRFQCELRKIWFFIMKFYTISAKHRKTMVSR